MSIDYISRNLWKGLFLILLKLLINVDKVTIYPDVGTDLNLCRPQVTIATAIIFCHRFFLRQSHAKNDRRVSLYFVIQIHTFYGVNCYLIEV